MNTTFFKSPSTLYPCPPLTGLGYMNQSGTLYLICDEQFYEQSSDQRFEAPLTTPVLIAAYTLTIILAMLLICGAIMTRGRYIGYTRHQNSMV
jgi:hypothetical protein